MLPNLLLNVQVWHSFKRACTLQKTNEDSIPFPPIQAHPAIWHSWRILFLLSFGLLFQVPFTSKVPKLKLLTWKACLTWILLKFGIMKSKQAAALQHLTCYIYPQLHLIHLPCLAMCWGLPNFASTPTNSRTTTAGNKPPVPRRFLNHLSARSGSPVMKPHCFPQSSTNQSFGFYCVFMGSNIELHPKTNV